MSSAENGPNPAWSLEPEGSQELESNPARSRGSSPKRQRFNSQTKSIGDGETHTPKRPAEYAGEVRTGERPPEFAVEVRMEVKPAWPFRLRGSSGDGLYRRKGGSLQRLFHIDGRPAHVGVMMAAPDKVLFAARSFDTDTAEQAITRMRFALSIDDDLSEFHRKFRSDPYIGKALLLNPYKRISRNPQPWEAFAWAVTAQLIEVEEAFAIQRRLVWRLGSHYETTNMRDGPSVDVIAGAAPAEIEACGLSHARSLALRRAALEVKSGRVDLQSNPHEEGWKRLMAIPGIGRWTIERLASHGQGRYDQIPAGDLMYLKLIGRLQTSNPQARADEDSVREFFSRYGEWQGLAGLYLAMASSKGLMRTKIE